VELSKILVLADESANWKIAGLRQLDRVALEINEFCHSQAKDRASVCVWWKPAIACERRWLPQNQRLTHLYLTDCAKSFADKSFDAALSTRFLLYRGGLAEFVAAQRRRSKIIHAVSSIEPWQQSFDQVERIANHADADFAGRKRWEYVRNAEEIASCEKRLLRASAKSEDGLVSRFINRPVSRWVSRVLLKFSVTPNQCSLLTSLIVIPACIALAYGNYFGFVIGTALLQLHSMLDGCDGEIARAKYVESERGRNFDAFCDLTATLLFVLSLGIGLFRRPTVAGWTRATYLGESILSFLFLAMQWSVSRRQHASFGQLSRGALDSIGRRVTSVSSLQNERRISDSAIHLLSTKLVPLLYEITKRDIVFFVFALLALANLSPWILHCVLVFSLTSFALTTKSLYRRRLRDINPAAR
jgi:phosphatidylglycerophosphate synthase